MYIWRIFLDNSNNKGVTLNQLMNKIYINFKNDKVKNLVKEEVRFIKYDANIKTIEKKITKLRHNYESHLNYKNYFSSTSSNKIPIINIDDLKRVYSKIVKLFDIVCFGNGRQVYVNEYNSGEPNKETDIDNLLDNIAKESYFIKGEQEILEIFQKRINQLSESDLNKINKYRKKFEYIELTKKNEKKFIN